MIKKGAVCAKEDKMKKLLATFAVTTLLVILAVSAVSCVYLPDGDRTIDYGALGEPVFADEFDVFDASVWRAANDGVRRGGYWDIGQVKIEDGCMIITTEYLWLSVEISGEGGSGNPANPDNEFTWGGEIASNEGGKDFVSEFVIDYVRCYDVDEIPFVK